MHKYTPDFIYIDILYTRTYVYKYAIMVAGC